MIKELILYSTLLATTATYAYPFQKQETILTESEQSKLETLVDFNNSFFTEKAQECLNQSPVRIYHIKEDNLSQDKAIGGFYSDGAGERGINERNFRSGSDALSFFEDSLFHESIHRLVDCGELSIKKFIRLYTKMDPNNFPIKNKVEERLEDYSFHKYNLDGERIAYLAQLLVMSTEYDIPTGLQEFFKPVLKIGERKEFVRGLTGTPLE